MNETSIVNIIKARSYKNGNNKRNRSLEKNKWNRSSEKIISGIGH